jgi:hypothetical protein
LKSQSEYKEKVANKRLQQQNQQIAKEKAELRSAPKINPKSRALVSSRSKANLINNKLSHNNSLVTLNSSFAVWLLVK